MSKIYYKIKERLLYKSGGLMTNSQKGLAFGILVGIAWGLDTVLMGMLSQNSLILSHASSATSLVIAFLHDIFCFMWLVLVMCLTKKLLSTFKLLTTKRGKAVCVAALVGAPIGMSGFVLGIKYAAPAYASAISVIYPGIGAILAYFILKEKLPIKAVLGIVLSIIGSAALGYSKVDMSLYPHFYLGIAFSLIAVLGWASEGVILGYAMKKIKTEENISATPEQFLTLRYLTSAVIYGLVIMPIVGGYHVIGQLSLSVIFSFMGIAILGAITYLSWYKAVDYVGAGLGTALNSTASFWALIFSWIILKQTITPYLMICCGIIVVGIFTFALASQNKQI